MTSPPEGLAEFYAARYDRLVRLLSIAAGSRSVAEDLVQDAFVRLIPRWSTVSTYDDPEAWLRLVAFRLLSNRSRHLLVSHRVLQRLSPRHSTPAPDEERLEVRRALSQLPIAQRQVLVLHELLDLPVEQVAAELRIPVGTVKSRLTRARRALIPLLEQDKPNE